MATATPGMTRSPSRASASPLGPLLSDEQLARRAGDGDERAFEVLYGRYRDPLYRYCCAFLRRPEDAEEALQAAMLGAYRALGAGREGPVRPWLYRIARNACIDLWRRRPGWGQLSDAEPDPAGSPAEVAEGREELDQLRRDLAMLEERQRSALVLRELSGLSHAEIGSAMGESSQIAKRLIHEARQTLHDFAAGRELPCAEIRRRLSHGDGRVLRGRAFTAHLRSCAGCEAFQAALRERPRQLAALFPILPALAAQRVFEGVFAGGAVGGALSGSGGLLAGTSAGISAGGGAAGGALGGLAVKVAVAGVLAIGGGALAAGELHKTDAPSAPRARQGSVVSLPSRAAPASVSGGAGAPARPETTAARPESRRPAEATPADRPAGGEPVAVAAGPRAQEPSQPRPGAGPAAAPDRPEQAGARAQTRPASVDRASSTRAPGLTRTPASGPAGATPTPPRPSPPPAATPQPPAATPQPPSAAPAAPPAPETPPGPPAADGTDGSNLRGPPAS